MSDFQKYDYLYKIIIIGDAGVGKSALSERFIDNTFSDVYCNTIGIDFKIQTMKVNGKFIKVQIWDTAGQERFRSLISTYYRGSHGCLLVYDTTNLNSLNNLLKWYKDLLPFQEEGSIIGLVGTKIDLEELRMVEKNDVSKIMENIPANFHIETSSKKNTNINKVFKETIYQILESNNTDTNNLGNLTDNILSDISFNNKKKRRINCC